MVMPPRWTSSNLPFGKLRVSSGWSKRFRMTSNISLVLQDNAFVARLANALYPRPGHLHRAQYRLRLVHGFLELALRIGIRHNSTTCLQKRLLAFHQQRTD